MAKFVVVFGTMCGVLVGVVSASTCFPGYQCRYSFEDPTGQTWQYDFSGLCTGVDYEATDPQNHTYKFNVCGSANSACFTPWRPAAYSGPAVQFWGEVPACNTTAPACTDANGNAVCCTASCEILGSGRPLYALTDATNPLFGGITITFASLSPSPQDMYKCPINPKTHVMFGRTPVLDMACDTSLPRDKLVVLGASQDPVNPCTYTIHTASSNACGCAPDCNNKNCGSDGCGGFCGSLFGGCPIVNKVSMPCVHSVCCKPDCTYRQCGSDGCGGSCGTCPGSSTCDSNQQCCSADTDIL